jgi:hypothetical protein
MNRYYQPQDNPMDFEIVCQALVETIKELDGYDCRWEFNSTPKMRPVSLLVQARLVREDGHSKVSTIATVQWNKFEYFILADSQSPGAGYESAWSRKRRMGYDWMDPVKIHLVEPDWKKRFQEELPKFRAKAASRKGKGGKNLRRNMMKWK